MWAIIILYCIVLWLYCNQIRIDGSITFWSKPCLKCVVFLCCLLSTFVFIDLHCECKIMSFSFSKWLYLNKVKGQKCVYLCYNCKWHHSALNFTAFLCCWALDIQSLNSGSAEVGNTGCWIHRSLAVKVWFSSMWKLVNIITSICLSVRDWEVFCTAEFSVWTVS